MKHIIFISIFTMFTTIVVAGQSNYNITGDDPNKIQDSVTKAPSSNQELIILQLQEENQLMKKRIEIMEKENSMYFDELKRRISDSDNAENRRLNSLGILMTLLGVALGVAAPLYIAYLQRKNIDEKIKEAKAQTEDSLIKIQSKVNDAEKAAKEAKASQLYAQALKEDDPANAIELYSRSIDISPSSNAYNNRANLKDSINDFTGAIQDYNNAIELKPQNAFLYEHRAISKSHIKDYLGALSDYKKAIELNSEEPDYYSGRGIIRYHLKNYNGALEDYNTAIELNPQNASYYYNRANAECSMKKYKEALEDYNKAIELNSQNAEFYNNRAIVNYKLQKYKEAIEDYSKAIELNPNFLDAYNNRARTYRKMAKMEQDQSVKSELISKAEIDEERAKSL